MFSSSLWQIQEWEYVQCDKNWRIHDEVQIIVRAMMYNLGVETKIWQHVSHMV